MLFVLKNKIFKNILWLFFDKILRMTLGVIVSVYLAKYLGPKDFGEFSFCISFCYFFLVVSMLGMEPILIKELTDKQNDTSKILSTSFFLRICSGGILFLLCTFFSFSFFEINKALFIIIISIQFLTQSFDVFGSFFLAKVDSKYVVISKNIGFIISSLFKLLLIYLNVSLLIFAYSILVEFIISAILLAYFFKKNQYIISFGLFDKKLARSLIYSSAPLILSTVFYVIYTKLDQIMIGFLSNSQEVGFYAVANKLSEIWFFIPTIIVNSFYSKIIKQRNENYSIFKEKILELMSLLSFLSLLFIVFFSIFSRPLIIYLYGVEYDKSIMIFNIHIWSCLIVFSAVVSGLWYVANGLQKYTFYRTGMGAFINVLLNLILIPIYGGIGAAIATLIAKITASYLMNLMNNKTREVFYLQTKGYINCLKIYPIYLNVLKLYKK